MKKIVFHKCTFLKYKHLDCISIVRFCCNKFQYSFMAKDLYWLINILNFLSLAIYLRGRGVLTLLMQYFRKSKKLDLLNINNF